MEAITMFDDAYSILKSHMPKPQSKQIPVQQALNHALATEALARIDVPPFARSMMDGFAVHSEDLLRGTTLTVKGTTAAGDESAGVISKGNAMRVMTGAPVPAGAAAVVRDEWCEMTAGDHVRILRSVETGSSIQPLGDDGKQGAVLVGRGRQLTELDLAVLQTFGLAEVEVYPLPTVAILVTGTELVADIRQPLEGGQIYGANDTLLRGALVSDGFCVGDVTYIPDNLSVLRAAVQDAADKHDVVLITGGVSVGDFDYTPQAIESLGSTIHLRKVLMRPGSPFVFATLGDTALFGLSGNPAACFAQFSVLVRPALHVRLGRTDVPFPHSGKLCHDLSLKPIKHTRVQRASVRITDGELFVDCALSQSTGVVSSLGQTDAYIRLDKPAYQAGEVVPLRFVRSNLSSPLLS